MSETKEYSLDHVVGVGEYAYYNGSALCMPKLCQLALSSDKELTHFDCNGFLTKTLEEALQYLKDTKGRILYKNKDYYVFWWGDSYMDFRYDSKTKGIGIGGYSLNPELLVALEKFKTDFVDPSNKNMVFAIIKEDNRLSTENLGDGSSVLYPENYNPEVIDGINFAISSYQQTPPIGRIVIINGEPGTGKTHLIRSCLSQIDCVFLVVSSSLIDALDKPEFIPLLLHVKKTYDKPIILIIEDGDVCLVPRKNDNISTITSLLNLSDGILGSIMDIRLIISTNATIKDMDQAILRPGRLCKMIHVGPLEYDQANKVYQRLMNDTVSKLKYRKHYTLAEVYDIFNKKDLPDEQATMTKKTIGFSFDRNEESNTDRTMNVLER